MNSVDATSPVFAATERLDSCPNCGGRRLAEWCTALDRLHGLGGGQRFTYSVCGDCRLLFLSLRPLEAEAYKYYPDDYGPHQAPGGGNPSNGSAAGVLGPLKSFLQRAAGFVNYRVGSRIPDAFVPEFEKFYRPPHAGARLLDFGCGSDRFLNWAREQGWQTLGIDFAPRSVELARRSGHEAFLMSPAVWDSIADESLDCVRINHVLEHLYRPKEVLAALARKMKPGARMHIAVPNPGGLSASLFGSRWRGLDCPRHVALYPAATLRGLLAGLGLSDVDIRHETATRDLIGSIGYLMRDAKLIEPQGPERMLDSAALEQLLFVPARLGARFARGDRIHAFVRKG
jgi:SAM-dependent methyltransferase